MNWWIMAGGSLAAISAAGHALAGRTTFFRPIRAQLADRVQAAVFTGMWHFITAHFALSALWLLGCGYLRRSDALVISDAAG